MSHSSLFVRPVAEQRPTSGAVLLTFGLTCFSFLIYQLGGAYFKMAVEGLELGIPVAWILAVSQLVFLFVPALFLLRAAGLNFTQVFSGLTRGFSGTHVTPAHFILGIICVFAIQVFSAAFVPLQYELLPTDLANQLRDLGSQTQKYYFEVFGEPNAWNYSRSLIVAALVPALAEETLFRGYLQRILALRFAPVSAVLLTSLLFSALHVNPDAVVPLFLVGALFGLAAWHTGSLLLPIFLHFFNNAVAVTVYFSMPDLSDTSAGEGSWGVALLALLSLGLLFAAFVRLTPGAGQLDVPDEPVHPV